MSSISLAYTTEHIVIVLIDGVRYTESLGDPTGQYCPRMTALGNLGVVQDSAFNDSVTVTAFAIPSTWMGRFYPLQDTTYQGNPIQFCRYPSIWEYARHDLGLPVEKTIYVTPDYGSSTWQPSFYPGYGPSFWPDFVQPSVSDDNNQADFDSAITAIQRQHPVVSYIYLPDSDHAGHSGIWDDYIAEIRQADSLVGELWEFIQADTIMSGKTTMFVTNDHGRHDDAHGGFQWHGDSCFGCRHVMMLAIGPDFKHGARLNSPRASIKDITRTAGELLGFNAQFSTGRVMEELFYSCPYVPGDVNYTGRVSGPDVIYFVNYLKGGFPPPQTCDIGDGPFYVAADINGDCAVNGIDISFFVNFLKGFNPQILHCPDYTPGE